MMGADGEEVAEGAEVKVTTFPPLEVSLSMTLSAPSGERVRVRVTVVIWGAGVGLAVTVTVVNTIEGVALPVSVVAVEPVIRGRPVALRVVSVTPVAV